MYTAVNASIDTLSKINRHVFSIAFFFFKNCYLVEKVSFSISPP